MNARLKVTWAMRSVLLVGVLLLVAFLARALSEVGGAGLQQVSATWVSDAIVLSAVSVCLWRAAIERREREVWTLAGLGMASWGLGNAYFEHKLAGGASLPNPSPADAGYLAFYPLVYLAVIAIGRHGRRPDAGVWLDGLIGAAACATVSAALVLEPVLEATKGESVAGALTNIAYPIGDLTLLAMLVMATATVGWRSARGLVLLAAGMALFAFSDSLYIVEAANGNYQVGGPLDAGWLLALLLMAAGAATLPGPRPSATEGAAAPEHAIVPALAGAAALVVLGLGPFTQESVTTLVLAISTLALVVARLALSLRETGRLLRARAREALLDALTGLGNRRALLSELRRRAREATEEDPLLLVLFDLDGFKTYNDTFGHNAGDALLVEVARSLAAAVGPRGRAYRVGGDEFCALLSLGEDAPEELGEQLAEAMAREGEGFSISASYGCAVAPLDGRETTRMMRRADDEMYARKGRRRPGTERQVRDALLAVLRARDPELDSRAGAVARLAAALGRYVGLGATDQRALAHAAALHDVGKVAIPERLLDPPVELSPEERRTLHTHPLIAERIIAAAPSLAYAAQIVRSTHERWDGSGYPDGLSGEAIPLSARIIAVCSAFKAMTELVPGQPAMSDEEAIGELRRGAGSRFDPELVAALIEVLHHPAEHPAREPAAGGPVPMDSRRAGRRMPLEAALSYQADHDMLTGLLNRRRFAEELERMLRYAVRYRRAGALLVLDLDDLKLVNDVHGHVAGDNALKAVAEQIAGRARATDAIARLGGDEFGIALNEVGEAEALRVAEDLRSRVAAADIDPAVHVSVGISLFDGAAELVADDLLTAADVALFEAKQAGRGQVRVYQGEEEAGLHWVQRIRDALADQRLVLYAQPIVDLRTGRPAFRELLVRMIAEDGSVVPPAAFLATAERFGLVNEIDRWVTREALRMALEGERVTINLSAHSIGDSRVLEILRRAAQQGLRRDRVIFEITETAAMANLEDARVFTERLDALGCDVALDDFGTGFASFTYLKHLPTRYLKIDMEFVRELASNVTDQKVVRSIADVGHSLGKLIVAEGVEGLAPLRLLREYEVEYAQGVHFGLPERISPPTQLEEELAAEPEAGSRHILRSGGPPAGM